LASGYKAKHRQEAATFSRVQLLLSWPTK